MGWGLGHVALGERRGWLLLTLEAAWLAALFAAAMTLVQTDAWMFVFVLLVGFFAVWAAQAVAAYRLAVALGRAGGGAGAITALAPVAIVALTLLWLAGGRVSTPGATFQRYVAAWLADRPAEAAALFVTPMSAAEMTSTWIDHASRLANAPDAQAADGLRYEIPDGAQLPDRVTIDLEVVRLTTRPGNFLGVFPATRSETELLRHVGRATVVRVPIGPAILGLQPGAWRIEVIEID